MTTIAEYANHIMGEIANDIAEGRMPANVRSFSDLHTYLDANDYTPDAGIAYTGTDENLALINDVEDEVGRRLATRTTYCTFGACSYRHHDHSTQTGRDGESLPAPVGATCYRCGQPSHFDYRVDAYRHDDPTAPACFLT
jgi:hypothetical protein